MLVITVLDVLAVLRWMFIAIAMHFHYSVRSIWQCALIFIPKLVVYCSVLLLLCLSLLCWMFTLVCCVGYYYFGYVLHCAVFFITFLVVYCSGCRCHNYV